MPTNPKIIAHRGGVVDADRSENSFKALEEAIHRNYTHVEIDARITADGHTVCFHNDDLQEEAGISGRISEMSLAKVLQTKLTRSGEYIPPFEAYCERCAGRINVMVDLKGCNTEHITDYASQIESALAKHHLLQNALILINKIPVNNQAEIAQHFASKTKVSWRHPLPTTQLAAEKDANFAKNHYVFNHGADFDQETIVAYQNLGLEVIVSINTHHYKTGNAQQQGEAHAQQMLAWGVDGLQIDSCFDVVL